jgi:hypothetical protein
MGFEVLMAVILKITVFRDVTLSSLLGRYYCFGQTCPEDENSRSFQNIGAQLPH